MASAGEPPEEVPSSIAPCWRAPRAYAGINPGPTATTPGGWLHLLAERTCGGQRRLFCGRGNRPPGVVVHGREGCVPMYLTIVRQHGAIEKATSSGGIACTPSQSRYPDKSYDEQTTLTAEARRRCSILIIDGFFVISRLDGSPTGASPFPNAYITENGI